MAEYPITAVFVLFLVIMLTALNFLIIVTKLSIRLFWIMLRSMTFLTFKLLMLWALSMKICWNLPNFYLESNFLFKRKYLFKKVLHIFYTLFEHLYICLFIYILCNYNVFHFSTPTTTNYIYLNFFYLKFLTYIYILYIIYYILEVINYGIFLSGS